MVILYTETEGGEWIPFNTPMSAKEIHDNLWKQNDDGMICKEDGLYYPHSDILPILHSVLLPDASRWDAVNWEWVSYRDSTEFKSWWTTYIEHYRLGIFDPTFFWRDQGPGLKINDLKMDLGLLDSNSYLKR